MPAASTAPAHTERLLRAKQLLEPGERLRRHLSCGRFGEQQRQDRLEPRDGYCFEQAEHVERIFGFPAAT
jgi:hypothetical protein